MSLLLLNLRHYRAYPQRNFLGHATEPVEFDSSKVAFVVVDVYGLGYSDEDGAPHERSASDFWTVDQERQVNAERIKPALDAARSLGLPIIYVSNSAPRIALHNNELIKQLKRSIDFNWEECCAEDVVDPLEYHSGPSKFLKYSKLFEPQSSDYFIRKLYYSGFKDTRLDALLRDLDVKTLVFVGYAADVCLHCTMIDALNLNYEVILLRDCTLSGIEALAGEKQGTYGFTDRTVIWSEIYVGRTTTSEDFARACGNAKPGNPA